MTKEEAIKWLSKINDKYIHGGDDDFDAKRKQAIAMAIKALQTPPISQRSMYQAGYKQGREDVLQDMKEGSIDGCNNKK